MYLLFDIGGTKMRLAISRDDQTIEEPKIIPTPQNFEEAIKQFKETAAELTKGEKITLAAGGVRALGIDKKSLANRPRLPLWVGEPLYDRLAEAVNAPLFLENDADMAGLGEAARGGGKGYKIVAYLTISTRVGGSRIVEGKIDNNTMGFEPGYQIIHDEKVLGDYISGRALENLYLNKPEDITDPQIWDKVARNLAIGLNNLTVLWSPELIILGGAVTQSIPLEKVEKYLKQLLVAFPNPPMIVKSELGDAAGLYGALEYLKQNLNP